MLPMARFLVQLKGENFILSLDGDHGRFGLLANREILASTMQEAERKALIQLYQQLNLEERIVKSIPNPPKIAVVSCKRIRRIPLIGRKTSESIDFFREEDDPSAGDNDGC
jgi:hypothetical protein